MYLGESLPFFGFWLLYLYHRLLDFSEMLWRRQPWACISGLGLRVEWGLCGAHDLYLTYLCPKSLPALTFYNYLHPPPKSIGKYARSLSTLTLCSPDPSSSTGATHIHWQGPAYSTKGP